MPKEKAQKRKLIGIVVGDRMQKTRTVAVTRLTKHPKYLKFFKVTKRFKAHDETNEYKKGETVVIQETNPISRDKRWIIVGRITKGVSTTKE